MLSILKPNKAQVEKTKSLREQLKSIEDAYDHK